MQSRLLFQPKASPPSAAAGYIDIGTHHGALEDVYTEPALWEQDAQWVTWKTSLQSFKGTLNVLELCGGSGAGYMALQKLLPISALKLVGHWDTDLDLRPILNVLHGRSASVHLGPVLGNIMQSSSDSFPLANILMAGPPCPPWSSMGLLW